MFNRFLRVAALLALTAGAFQARAAGPAACPTIGIATASSFPASGTVQTAYGPVAFSASGGTTPYSWAITGGLPQGSGLSIDASGNFSGTPAVSGNFLVDITAIDANGCSGGRVYALAVGMGSQTITFTSTAPAGATVGGPTYTVTATASSGLPVALSVDASAAAVCSLAGTTVSFIGAGTCVIDANQAGNANYSAAPQVQQSFAVGQGNQTITFTSTAPANASVGGPTYNVTATASSGLAVTLTIDASSASVCSISGNTVSFTGAGTCLIDANQAGDANWNVAPQAQQSFSVAKNNQTITFTSTPPPAAKPGDPSYTVMATASSGLAVVFTIDASASSVCSISGSTVSFTADGTCVIDANQPGNASFNAAPQVQQSFVVDTPPTVTSTVPTNGATSVPLASTISITFSKSVTVTGTAFGLACSPGTAPSFTVTPASPATTFVLHPTANLPFDSSCTVTVTHTQVTDAASRTMTADYMFSFSTPPIAINDTYPETLIGNVSIDSSTIPFSVFTNDQFNSPVTITAFDATSANGGTVSMNTSNGQFTFNPAAGYTGADSFTYTISNAHGSATATVSMTISGMIWFINNAAGAGDGRLSSPFNSLAAFQAVNDGAACNALNTPRCHPAANGNIFLYDSATGYTGPVTLLNGQKLIGQDATSSLAAISGLTPGTSSAALPATGGGSPNIVGVTSAGNTVTLGSGNTVWGMTLGNATGTALTGASVGALKIRDLSINTTGAALNLANGALDAILDSVSSGGGTNGISLSATTGSFDIEGGGASDPTNATQGRTTAKNGGGTLTLGSGGTIQNATGAGILMSNATNVTLRNVTIQNNGGAGVGTGADGIRASSGSGLLLDNVLITGHAGNNGLHASGVAGVSLLHTEVSNNATNSGVVTNGEWNVRFDNVTGTATINNSLLDTSYQNVIGVINTGSTTLAISANNDYIHDASTNTCVYTEADNSANLSLTLTNSTVNNCYNIGVVYNGNGNSGGGKLTVTGSKFDGNGQNAGADIAVAHGGGTPSTATTYSFDFENNTTRQVFVPTSGDSISVDLGGNSIAGTTLQGKIINNTIGNQAVTDSGSAQGTAIALQANGAGTITAAITGNIVRQANSEGLAVLSSGTTDTVNVTISGNDLQTDTAAANTNDYAGAEVTAGGGGGSDTICANISSNTQFNAGGTNPNATAGIIASALSTSNLLLQGYGGAANDINAIQTFLNTTATTIAPPPLANPGGGTIRAAPSACPTPP